MAEMFRGPNVGVLSGSFPCSLWPETGQSIRDRVFRIARRLPLFVVSPTPWVPLEDWFRENLNPAFRPSMPEYEEQHGIPVWFPRFMAVPGLDALRLLDGWAMAKGAASRFDALRSAGRLDLIDAHGAYPEGYAGILLGRRFGVPVTITLHGSELASARDSRRVRKMREAFGAAARIFAVSESLRQFALELGAPENRLEVVANGVDAECFSPRDRGGARNALGISSGAPVLVSSGSGGSSGEKNYNRVIEALAQLSGRWPGLVCLFVGLDVPSMKRRAELEAMIEQKGLKETVRFLDPLPPKEMPDVLSAADVFVLAAHHAGSTAPLLEAMACGLPAVAFDAGISREIISRPEFGELAPYGDPSGLRTALDIALSKTWNRVSIRRHSESWHWDGRVNRLCRVFTEAVAESRVGA